MENLTSQQNFIRIIEAWNSGCEASKGFWHYGIGRKDQKVLKIHNLMDNNGLIPRLPMLIPLIGWEVLNSLIEKRCQVICTRIL